MKIICCRKYYLLIHQTTVLINQALQIAAVPPFPLEAKGSSIFGSKTATLKTMAKLYVADLQAHSGRFKSVIGLKVS